MRLSDAGVYDGCQIEGCTRPLEAHGLCATHDARKRRHGDPLTLVRGVGPDFCTVEGCSKVTFNVGRGLCAMHYARWQRHGDIAVMKYPNRGDAEAVREVKRQHATKRRLMKLRGIAEMSFTLLDWRIILDEWGGRCAYCGDLCSDPEQEHVIPVSKGGEHTADNIVPACKRCNRKKGTHTAEEFLARLTEKGSKNGK